MSENDDKKEEKPYLEMDAKIDMADTHEILAILEEMSDEEKSAKLLKEFNDASKELSELMLHQGAFEQSEQWKNNVFRAQQKVQKIIREIKKQQKL